MLLLIWFLILREISMINSFRFSKCGFTEVSNESNRKYLSFVSEPDFQLSILREQIPLILNKTIYYPMLAEFPASPGIDLIYVSVDCQLLLVEMKHKKYRIKDVQEQIIQQSDRYRSSTLQDLILYGENNVNESNQNVLNNYKKLISGDELLTIEDLISYKKCSLACLFYDDIQISKDTVVYVDLFGIKYKDGYLYQHTIQANKDIDDMGKIILSRTNKLKKQNRKRKKWTKKQIKDILSNHENEKIRMIYDFSLKMGYDIKPGSGKNWFCSIVFRVDAGKKYTIIGLNDTHMSIHANLYYQLNYLKASREDIDNFMSNIKNTLNKDDFDLTDGETISISIAPEKKNKQQIEYICKLVSSFTTLCTHGENN